MTPSDPRPRARVSTPKAGPSKAGPSTAEARADAVFGALADPTRRAVLRAVVARAPVTATELADDLPVSRQAVAKHLGVLRDAGLVTVDRQGREVRFAAQPAELDAVTLWVDHTRRAWDRRLDRLHVLAEQIGKGRRVDEERDVAPARGTDRGG